MADYPEPTAWQNFSDGIFFRLSSIFKSVLKAVFDSLSSEDSPVADFPKNANWNDQLFQHNASQLLSAVDKGFGKVVYGSPSEELLFQLRRSAVFFSAHKTFSQVKELGDLMIRPDGTIRPWAEFRRMAAPLVQKYNITWLKAEYDAAQRSARAAKDYQKALRDMDLYPNLKYLSSLASNPRDSHKKFYGLVRPVDDPVWALILPPSDWGCKCSVEQTTDPVTSIPEDFEMPKGPFANNPAISGELFSQEHPYFQKTGNLDSRANIEIDKGLQALVRDAAREKLIDKTVSNGAFKINFSITGIKEAANNPHREKVKKNLLLADPERLLKIIKEANYEGYAPNNKESKRHVKNYHYFSFRLAGQETSYFVMEERTGGEGLTLYSVVERLKENDLLK